MKRILMILALVLPCALTYAAPASEDSADSLLNKVQTLPHDTARLRLLEKLVLTEQSSPHYLDYANEMFKEAQLQNNDTYLASSTYYKLMYYYNKDEADSVKKLVSYLLPIAERMDYRQMYFSAQKLLIYTYIYREKFEFAINEALKMQEKADSLDNLNGRIAACLCLASAYRETDRRKKEGEVLQKVYELLPKVKQGNTKINVLAQLIIYSNSIKDYASMKSYLDQNASLLNSMLEEYPEMQESYYNLFLFSELHYMYYYSGIQKTDSTRIHMLDAQKYINSQSFFPYTVTYLDACTEYYQRIKDYRNALLYADSTLVCIQKPEFRKIDYARQLTRKADILQEMGNYQDALPLYELSNYLQDSLAVTVSAKQLEEIKDIYHLNQLVWEQGKLRSRIQICILVCLAVTLILCIAYMFRINLIRKALKISEKETLKATRQTEMANEMKNRFLSNMSHAIRVPLNGVLGFSQIIANGEEMDDDTRKEYAEIIKQNTEQLMELVNNVLDLSRLEAGMMKFQLSDYDVVQLCSDALGGARMHNPNLHIHFQHSIEEYTINTDCNRMMQLIISTLICPGTSLKVEREIQFTLTKNGENLCFKVTNSPLADLRYANQDTALRNDVNQLLLKHFGGTYQVMAGSQEGPTILFTYPAPAAE